MKRILLLVTILIVAGNLSFSQNRTIARGAELGELYITGEWYGIYNPIWGGYDTLRVALFRFTENGKKLTIQYDIDYGTATIYDILPGVILADATFGVLYNRQFCFKNDGYIYTQLYVSFNYGKSWVFREENIGYDVGLNLYWVANVEGLIYRWGGGGFYKSENYGYTFFETNYGTGGTEPGLQNGEAFSVWDRTPSGTQGRLIYTCDFGENYIEIPIDSQYVCYSSDVYRGALPGEVYVSSRFPDWTFHVSFSADTGYTFRKVFISESYNPWDYAPIFMSDREPGVFYIIRSYMEEDLNPWGEHKKLCIYYYRDYGETLVDIYCHDITKDYGKTCEAVTDLVLEKCNPNCILLTWSEPESSLPVEGYHIYRNEQLLNEQLTINTTYYDENLPNGDYEYYVVTHYTTGCVSDTSNHVAERVELGVKGVKELGGVRVFPNPTTGELRVTSYELQVTSIEIFDVYGRQLLSHTAYHTLHTTLNISHLSSGIYIVQIGTDKGMVIRKVVKQ